MAVYGNIENLDAIVLAEVEAGARHIDGFSPIVETTATTNGEHIKITDKEAIHEFDILNGTALSVDVDGDTLVLDSDTTTYQPQEIEDVSGHFTATTVEGALDELYGTCADIAEDVDNLQDDLDTEVAAIRPISLGGTGASDAETAVSNLGIADYVVATGTSNAMKFRKWASGRAECWGMLNGLSANLTQIGTSGIYGGSISISLPIQLKNCVINGCSRYATGHHVPFSCYDHSGSLVSTVQGFIYDFYQRSGSDLALAWHAFGFWK